jgi:hypothetical protein
LQRYSDEVTVIATPKPDAVINNLDATNDLSLTQALNSKQHWAQVMLTSGGKMVHRYPAQQAQLILQLQRAATM